MHIIPSSTMRPGVFLLLGLLVLRADLGTAPEETGERPKPGECPAAQSGPSGTCRERCRGDSDCPDAQKCCNSSCGHQCLPPAPVVKPGTCPASPAPDTDRPCRDACAHDSDCPGSAKCCPLACGLACLPPSHEDASPAPATPQPLHQWRCHQDQDCPPPEVCCHQRCSAECHTHGRGVPTADPAWQEGTNCWSDGDCGDGETCCGGRCAGLCSAEHQGKAGFCPAHAGLFPTYDCRAWCRRDAECPGEQKCCLRGCDYVCLSPSQEKPGICPPAEETPTAAAPCGPSCAGDGQCPGAQKCCSSRCGHECLAPERGEGTVTGTAVPHTAGRAGKPPVGHCPGWGCRRAGAQSGWVPAARGVPLPAPAAPSRPFQTNPASARRCGRGGHRSRARSRTPAATTGTVPGRRSAASPAVPCAALVLPEITPGSVPRHSPAGTPGAGTGADAWTTASAGERKSAATPAAAGTAWPCPERAGAGPAAGVCRSARPTRSVPGDRGAPAPAAAASAWKFPEVEWECAPSPGRGERAWTCAALTKSVPGATSAAATAVAMSAQQPLCKNMMPQLCHSMVPSSAQRSARLTRSVPGDRGAPAPAAAAYARTPLEAEKERALSPGAVGHVWSCAASTRSVPGATSAAATAAATSAHGCLVILRDRRAAAWWQADTFVGGLRVVTGPSWPVPSLPPPAIKHTHGCLQPLLILSSTRPAPPGPGTGPCVPGAAPAAPGAHWGRDDPTRGGVTGPLMRCRHSPGAGCGTGTTPGNH
ncbi:multiple epidermal growth factor-like domains protein 6 isoform X5 [Columba livia]|uniref:multiple epidermal growth factor-like domains protein 6 isoform X5 n=1 Tax=Columba livia TaxID=8932 RepID=UPI0031BB8B7F